MHALMITFRSQVPVYQLEAPFSDYAHALGRIPGLISKVWINDGTTVGGFHLFTDRNSADAYLTSDLAHGLVATEGFEDFEIRHFDVLDALSALTGVKPTVPLAAT